MIRVIDGPVRCFVLLGLVAALAAVSVSPAFGERAPAAPTDGATAWPTRAGQGSTVLVRFTSAGCDDGIDSATCGYVLELTGPAATPCAGPFAFDEIVFFPTGSATFRLGPAARPTRGRLAERVRSYRPTAAWCPGTYTGTVRYSGASASTGAPPASFSFRIDRTRSGRSARGLAPKNPIRGYCRPRSCAE